MLIKRGLAEKLFSTIYTRPCFNTKIPEYYKNSLLLNHLLFTLESGAEIYFIKRQSHPNMFK